MIFEHAKKEELERNHQSSGQVQDPSSPTGKASWIG